MITRMWHGRVPSEKARQYREFLNERAIPDYRSVPGNISVHVLERVEGPVTHFVTMTLWESLAAIRGFAGEDLEVAKYYPEDQGFLLEFEPKVVHYEVVGQSSGAGPGKERINPTSVFRSVDHGFSQAVVASGRRTVYVSGQTAWDAQKQLVGGADLESQARQAFRNLQAVLAAAGGALSDVVSLRIYVVDYRPEKAAAVGGALRHFFSGEAKPASTWVGVSALADPRFLIEVEAIAVLD